MSRDIGHYILERCDDALQNNTRYLELQKELANAHEENDIDKFSKIAFDMQCIAMEFSYKLAFKDLHAVMKK